MWVRGLKPDRHVRERPRLHVAPYVGAWIETSVVSRVPLPVKSHPMWVRGLKHNLRINAYKTSRSHPMWVRGLKLEQNQHVQNKAQSHPMWVRGLKPYLPRI